MMTAPKHWQVLIIEDHADVLQVMALLLERIWGCAVVTAEDGPEGIGLALDLHVDVIFLDLKLPFGDGIEVIRTLKRSPNTARIPIVVVSEHCWQPDRRSELIREGAFQCIDKAKLFGGVQRTLDDLADKLSITRSTDRSASS